MARNKPTEVVNDDDEYPAEQGVVGALPNEPDNGMPSHDMIRMAVNEQLAFNERSKKLNAERSSFRKGLKAKGINLGVLDAKVRMLEWTPEEVKAHHAEQDWYAEALRFPIGAQLELYGADNTPDPVREQLRWRNIGFKDGVAARGWPDQPPEHCHYDCHQSYAEGHEEGQGTVRRAFVARQLILDAEPVEPVEDDDEPALLKDTADADAWSSPTEGEVAFESEAA